MTTGGWSVTYKLLALLFAHNIIIHSTERYSENNNNTTIHSHSTQKNITYYYHRGEASSIYQSIQQR
jgi:hypothetical protein